MLKCLVYKLIKLIVYIRLIDNIYRMSENAFASVEAAGFGCKT
jgi:hypothetical protein